MAKITLPDGTIIETADDKAKGSSQLDKALAPKQQQKPAQDQQEPQQGPQAPALVPPQIGDPIPGMEGETVTQEMLDDDDSLAGLLSLQTPQGQALFEAGTPTPETEEEDDNPDAALEALLQRQGDLDDTQLRSLQADLDAQQRSVKAIDKVEVGLRAAADALMAFGGNFGSNTAFRTISGGRRQAASDVEFNRQLKLRSDQFIIERAQTRLRQDISLAREKVKTREGLQEVISQTEQHVFLSIKTDGGANLSIEQTEAVEQIEALRAFREANPNDPSLARRYSNAKAGLDTRLVVYKESLKFAKENTSILDFIAFEGDETHEREMFEVLAKIQSPLEKRTDLQNIAQRVQLIVDAKDKAKSLDTLRDELNARAIARGEDITPLGKALARLRNTSAPFELVEGFFDNHPQRLSDEEQIRIINRAVAFQKGLGKDGIEEQKDRLELEESEFAEVEALARIKIAAGDMTVEEAQKQFDQFLKDSQKSGVIVVDTNEGTKEVSSLTPEEQQKVFLNPSIKQRKLRGLGGAYRFGIASAVGEAKKTIGETVLQIGEPTGSKFDSLEVPFKEAEGTSARLTEERERKEVSKTSQKAKKRDERVVRGAQAFVDKLLKIEGVDKRQAFLRSITTPATKEQVSIVMDILERDHLAAFKELNK